jgi:hypothetical protein
MPGSMNIRDLAEEDIILLVGSPRSGTTWLAKIIDSHPDVLYRHEPDKILRAPLMRRNFRPEEWADNRDAARAYARDLIQANYLKAIRILPSFRKNYQSLCVYYTKFTCLMLLGALGRLDVAHRLERVQIPDMISAKPGHRIKLLIKSIASHGRVGLMARAMPQIRIIYLIRDPFGHIASMRRGLELGKFEKRIPLEECLETEYAAAYGLTRATFERLPMIEQITWHWALLNKKMIADIDGHPRAMTVSYDALCADPAGQARSVFSFAGLTWHERTATFVIASTTANGRDEYYGIYKNTAETLGKSRERLSQDEQSRIEGIIRETGMTDYCRPPPFDPAGAATPPPSRESPSGEQSPPERRALA